MHCSGAWLCELWPAAPDGTLLPQSMASVDSRTIYAVAYATANINTATTQAGNATDIQKAAYYTQAIVSAPTPAAEPCCRSVCCCACPESWGQVPTVLRLEPGCLHTRCRQSMQVAQGRAWQASTGLVGGLWQAGPNVQR